MAEMPMQPLRRDADGVVRFVPNKIVRFLLDAGKFDLNALAAMPGASEVYAGAFSREEWEQFAQLIGYSVGGFADLSYVSDEAYAEARRRADALPSGPAEAAQEGRRDG